MPQDASQASLPDVFRSLNVAPDYKAALVQLAEEVSQLKRKEYEREHQGMLSKAAAPSAPPPPPGPRHKQERHLRVVRAGGIVAVMGTMLRWCARIRAHKAIAAAAGAALAGTAIVAPAAMMAPAAAPLRAAEGTVPALIHPHRHGHPAGLPPLTASTVRHHRRRHTAASPKTTPPPSPSPADLDPSPSPDPDPSPTVSLPPPVQGMAQWALGTAPGLINQGGSRRTSAVLNPGPRLLAGSTVTVKQAATSARWVASGSAPNSLRVIPA